MVFSRADQIFRQIGAENEKWRPFTKFQNFDFLTFAAFQQIAAPMRSSLVIDCMIRFRVGPISIFFVGFRRSMPTLDLADCRQRGLIIFTDRCRFVCSHACPDSSLAQRRATLIKKMGTSWLRRRSDDGGVSGRAAVATSTCSLILAIGIKIR